MVREAFIWTLVVCLGFMGAFYYEDLVGQLDTTSSAIQSAYGKRTQRQAGDDDAGFERRVRLIADRYGHFAVEAYINDRPAALVADTGATLVTLTYEDARRVGIVPAELRFTHQTNTANGVARVAPVTLRHVRIGGITVRDVRAVVTEPGKLHVSLLGMSFLGAITRFEMSGRELVLVQ